MDISSKTSSHLSISVKQNEQPFLTADSISVFGDSNQNWNSPTV